MRQGLKVIPLDPNIELKQLAKEINDIHKNAVFEIGNRLLRAKELLPHGEFMPWVIENCAFAQRQANEYMRITSRKDELPEEPKSLNQAVKQLSIIDSKKIQSQTSRTSANLIRPEKAPEGPIISDYMVNKLYQEALLRFENRSKSMIFVIREFLTHSEPTGRDIKEAIDNIDKFDSQEDLDQLRRMMAQCEQLATRAADTAKAIGLALAKRERLI